MTYTIYTANIKKLTKGFSSTSASKMAAILGLSSRYKLITVDDDRITEMDTNILLAEHNSLYNDLKEKKFENKEKHKTYKTYKGARYTAGLPARGQGTHSNAQTSRRLKNER